MDADLVKLCFSVFSFSTFALILGRACTADKAILTSLIFHIPTTLGQLNIITLAALPLLFVYCKINVRKSDLQIVALTIFVVLILGMISYNPSFENVLGKPLKILSIWLMFILIPYTYLKLNSVISLFILHSIAMFCIAFYLDIYINRGFAKTVRFTGMFYDPNFAAVILVGILLVLKARLKKFAALFFLLGTQSVTLISIYALFGRQMFSRYWRLLFILVVGFSLLLPFLAHGYFEIKYVQAGADGNYSAYALKANSLFRRLMAQIGGVEMLMSSYHNFAVGFGTGVAKREFGHVFHNAYFQMLFDHGYIGFVFLLLFWYRIFEEFWDKRLVLLAVISSVMFDPLFTGLIVVLRYIDYVARCNSIEKGSV